MKEKVVIVGSIGSSLAVQSALQNLGHNHIIIVDADNVKEQFPFPKNEPFILHNQYTPELKDIYEGNKFTCKGKHQYRLIEPVKKEMDNGSLVTEIWKCQCGKILGS